MSMHAVSLQKSPVQENPYNEKEPAALKRVSRSSWENWLRVRPNASAARWANFVLLISLGLFALSLPHSIAAAHISLAFSAVAWVTRDLLMRSFHWQRTPLDAPLAAFAVLTLLSTIFSAEPALSFPKLKSLLLFGVLYVLTANLTAQAIKPLLALLLLSGLCGVLFSIGDKLYGRGVIIKTIAPDSPLLREQPLGARLQPGDAIWMIGRRRVYSLSDIRSAIRQASIGQTLTLEALHQGDPIPATITVTAAAKAEENPLGISVSTRTHRFRVTGFGRQFQTYAEQMQLLALLCYGLLLVCRPQGWRLHIGLGIAGLFIFFSIGLMLTFTRAVLASFSLTVLLLPLFLKGKQAVLIGVTLVFLIASITFIWLGKERSADVMRDSTSRRFEYMQAGLRVIPRYPWLGAGMDATKRHWQEWGFPGDYVTHTHSTPIQIAMERGVFTLLVLIWFGVAAGRLAWKNYRGSSNRLFIKGLALSLLGCLVGFVASSLVNYNFGDAEVLLLLLTIIGLVAIADLEASTNIEPAHDSLG